MGFIKDIQLEIKHSKTIKAILGNYFIRQDVEMDKQQATDFLIFSITPFKCGARLRRFYYYQNYPNDITIRWSRPSGIDTEIHKIRKRLVQYILYGFVSPDENKIIRYLIGDLNVFLNYDPLPDEIRENKPPDSKLAAFHLCNLPKEFILKTWDISFQLKEIYADA